MPAPKKYLTPEAEKAARRESAKRWEARNPEKIKAKREREQARQKELRAQRKAANLPKPKPNTKTCVTCGEEKPLEAMRRHGSGFSSRCLSCHPNVTQAQADERYRAKKPRVWSKKSTAKLKALPDKAPRPTRTPKSDPIAFARKTAENRDRYHSSLSLDGWVKILGETDYREWLAVYIRNGVIMFLRGAVGSYSTGKRTYAVMFDDSGKRYPNYGAAERVAEKILNKPIDVVA
jgi:hypothetical protein